MQIVVGLLKRDGGEVERPQKPGYCPQVPMVWSTSARASTGNLCDRIYSLVDGKTVVE